MLHFLTLPLAQQDQLASLNFALIKKITDRAHYPSDEYYRNLLSTKLPEIYVSLYPAHALEYSSRLLLRSQLNTFFPFFVKMDENPAGIKTPYSIEEKLWKAGMRALNPTITF
jgi:hypothetical protein